MPLRSAALLLLLASARALAQQTPADTLLADGHYLRARPLVQAALAKNPNDVHALVQQSVLQWAFFRFDEAIGSAEKAIGLNGNSAEAHVQLTNALGAKLQSSSAGTFEKMGMARRFRKEADLSLQLDGNAMDAIEDAARFYWEAPSIAGGDKVRAQQLAGRLAGLDPARGAALKAGLLDPKDKSGVEGFWRTAVAARPESAEAHIGLSEALFQEGSSKYAAAESEARRALALKPSQVPAWRELAVLYASTGRWDDLSKLLKQARAAVPDDLSPEYHAARIIVTGNAPAQLPFAEQLLRSYLAQPPEGEEPSHAAAHWRLGLVLEKQGHRPEAVQELQAALREDPSFDPARKDLKRLT